MITVSTTQELIEHLGGCAEVARWAGYEDSRGVYNWLLRGIPPSYHMRLCLEAWARGIYVSPDVIGLEGDDAEIYREMMRPRPLKQSARPRHEARA